MIEKTKRFFRVVLYTMSLYIVTHVIVFSLLPFALLLSLLDRTSELQRLQTRFAKTVFRVVGQEIHLSGSQHIHPQAHYLVIANYPSGYAIFALIALFPHASFVAHEFISRIPLLRHIMRHLGTIFVNSKYPQRAYRELSKALERGISGNIIIMPEGQRSPDGEVHPFKRGFVHILRHSDLDLLPVTLNGFYKLKPANRVYLDPDTHLEVFIHNPIKNEMVKEMSDRQLIETVECIIKEQYQA
jgi:1-acyl-sn-glycerol-3-phosphate acyltransferase